MQKNVSAFIIEKLEVMKMKLNEKYNIMTTCGLMTCDGKRYNDDFAIVHNWKEDVFNVTHIASGTGIAPHGYSTLKECIERADADIQRGMAYLERHPDHEQKLIESYNNCLERNIFNN